MVIHRLVFHNKYDIIINIYSFIYFNSTLKDKIHNKYVHIVIK